MKPILINLSLGISILFSLGGAFNAGMTGFFMAIPFMALLCFLAFKKSRTAFVSALVFVLLCIVINLTLYKNPLVFPVLEKGVSIEVLHDSLYRKFSDEHGSFITSSEVYINEPTEAQRERLDSFLNNDASSSIEISDSAIVSQDNVQVIYKLKKSQYISIEGVHNLGGIASANRNYLLTELGKISEEEIEKGNIRIVPDMKVQSTWSRYLGNLMYWPVFPIVMLTAFK